MRDPFWSINLNLTIAPKFKKERQFNLVFAPWLRQGERGEVGWVRTVDDSIIILEGSDEVESWLKIKRR